MKSGEDNNNNVAPAGSNGEPAIQPEFLCCANSTQMVIIILLLLFWHTDEHFHNAKDDKQWYIHKNLPLVL